MPRQAPQDLLVCYDITEPKRLRRIHRHMRTWGIPIQYSVFCCRLTAPERKRLESDLHDLIDERTDDVRIYALHASRGIEFVGRRFNSDGVALHGLGALPVS